MKFGIFYEHQLPRPWDADSEYRLLHESLEQIELADRLGYHYAWEVEHHFLEEYSHSSAPEVFLARREPAHRSASGSATASSSCRPTIRRASPSGCRRSTSLSHGRVELGIGEGSTTTELHPFGRRFRDKRAVWEDAVRALIPMFGDEAVEYHGEYFDFPLRNVLPEAAPEAAPAAVGRVLAARHDRSRRRLGHGRARLPVRERRRGARVGAAYYNAYTKRLAQARRLRDQPEHRGRVRVHVLPDRRGGQRQGRRLDVLRVRAALLRDATVRADRRAEPLGGVPGVPRTPQAKKMHAGGLIGSPETIRTKLRKFEESHVDQVILLNQAGRNTHADICTSLELFAAEVMPEFVERDAEHQDWKRACPRGRDRARGARHVARGALAVARPAARSAPSRRRPASSDALDDDRGGHAAAAHIVIEAEGGRRGVRARRARCRSACCRWRRSGDRARWRRR